MKDGESILLGTVASQLAAQPGPKCFEDSFLDDALLYTLGAQVATTASACVPAPVPATPAPTPASSRP